MCAYNDTHRMESGVREKVREDSIMWNDGTLKKMRLSLACLGAAALLCGCGQQEESPFMKVEDSNDTITYDYCTVERGDVALTQPIRCTYTQQDGQEVSFSVTGRRVDKVYVEEGDKVKKGDVLAEFDVENLKDRIEDLEYRIARNEHLLEYAEINEALDISEGWVNYLYVNVSKEETEKMVSSIQENYSRQREDLQDALELDRMELDVMKQELKNSRVYAGINGMVYGIQNNLEGSTSKEGQVIMTIIDNSKSLFETNAVEYAGYFREGETVSMTIVSGSASGTYELLPYNMDGWGDVLQFSIYDGPSTTGIVVGTGGTMYLTLDSRKNVLYVPKTAVNSADDKYYVYVADEDNMRQIRWVETGLFGDDSVEILSGLEEGEKVIRR